MKLPFPLRHLIWTPPAQFIRSFRSDAALKAIANASAAKTRNLVLYNYPSISGSISAVFAHLYHSRLNLPCLILPFSSFIPFRVADFDIQGLERCFLLDFVGPKGFALQLSKQTFCEVIAFDHRPRAPTMEDLDMHLKFHIDPTKGTATSVYEYFSSKLALHQQNVGNEGSTGLLHGSKKHRMERLLDYLGARDLRKGDMPDIEGFNIGIKEWYSKLNCIINTRMFGQLCEINVEDVIAKGNSYISARWTAAKEFLDKEKVFTLRLGRGLYGECLGIRADDNPNLQDELGKLLCQKSAEAGLRPIGAVIYMKRNNLKMCLRSNDSKTDVSRIAKAYGGGGFRGSSSFVIRMDEYNQWRLLQQCGAT